MIAYATNSYVWELLKKHLDWSEINGLRPMIPAQQQPEFMNYKKPFIVYGFSEQFNDGELEPIGSVVVHYVVFAQNEETVDRSIKLIRDAFKAENSQENLNAWMLDPSNSLPEKNKDELATYTHVMDSVSAGGNDEEGGWKDGIISVRVGYKSNPMSYAI